MIDDVAHRLRLSRLAAATMAEVAGAVVRLGRAGGQFLTVGPIDDPRTDVLPCQHRGAIAAGLSSGSMLAYLRSLGLVHGGELTVELELPPSADLGSGVAVVGEAGEGEMERRLVVATTLCPHRAGVAARDARTVPAVVRRAGVLGVDDASAALAGLRCNARWDPELAVTVLRWSHRAHPAVIGPVDDAVRAVAAACAVDEVLSSLPIPPP